MVDLYLNLVTERINIEIVTARAGAVIAVHDEMRVRNADQRREEHAVAHCSAMAVGSMPYFDRRGTGGWW